MDNQLDVKLRLPTDDMPAKERFIIAVVNDGVETAEYKFGRHVPVKQIWEMVPRLYMDSKFPPKKKQKINRKAVS